jgi:IS30 family transposase
MAEMTERPVLKRKAVAPLPTRRRVLSDIEKAKIAWFAGQGWSALQIADAIGRVTPRTIYEYVRRCGLQLVHKQNRSAAFVVHVSETHWGRLEMLAGTRNEEPSELASHILTVMLQEPVALINILDDNPLD